MASIPKASHRKREIAFDPRLAVALAAGSLMRPRQALRPYVMIERHRKRSASKTDAKQNSASFTWRVSYTNDGDKISRRVNARQILSEGGGIPGGAPPPGGSWP